MDRNLLVDFIRTRTYSDTSSRDRAQFTLKLQGAEMEVKEAIERSRDAILHKVG